MTCSQLSSTIRSRSSRRKSTMAANRIVRSQDEPQRRCEGADHERRVFDRGQIDEQHRIAKAAAQGLGGGDCQGCLADATGPGDGDEPSP